MKKLLGVLVAWGPGGLLLSAVLDGAGLPIPGGVDALLIYLAYQRPEHPALLAAIAVVGSTVGNLALFILARRGGELYLQKQSKARGSARLRQWFQNYGLLTVFISALVPLPIMPMKIFVLCAGALGSSFWSFILVFVTARIPRYLVLALLGHNVGGNALYYLRSYAGQLALGAGVLFLVLYGLVKWADYRRRRAI